MCSNTGLNFSLFEHRIQTFETDAFYRERVFLSANGFHCEKETIARCHYCGRSVMLDELTNLKYKQLHNAGCMYLINPQKQTSEDGNQEMTENLCVDPRTRNSQEDPKIIMSTKEQDNKSATKPSGGKRNDIALLIEVNEGDINVFTLKTKQSTGKKFTVAVNMVQHVPQMGERELEPRIAQKFIVFEDNHEKISIEKDQKFCNEHRTTAQKPASEVTPGVLPVMAHSPETQIARTETVSEQLEADPTWTHIELPPSGVAIQESCINGQGQYNFKGGYLRETQVRLETRSDLQTVRVETFHRQGAGQLHLNSEQDPCNATVYDGGPMVDLESGEVHLSACFISRLPEEDLQDNVQTLVPLRVSDSLSAGNGGRLTEHTISQPKDLYGTSALTLC